MLLIAFGFLFIAVVLGLVLLSYVWRHHDTPKGLAFIHGPLAAIGLVLMIIYAVMNPSIYLIASIIMFCVAAMGGSYLIYLDLSGNPVPRFMALGHGLAALAGFILLIISIVNYLGID